MATDQNKASDLAKRLKYIYDYVGNIDKQLNPDTNKTVQRYKFADIYKPELVKPMLEKALEDEQKSINKTTLRAFISDPTELLVYFDKFAEDGELVNETYNVVSSDPKYGVYFDEKPTTKLVKRKVNTLVNALIGITAKTKSDEPIEVTEYAVKDLDGLLKAIEKAERKTLVLYKLELPQNVQLIKKTVDMAIRQNKPELLQDLPTADRYTEKLAQTYKLPPYGKSEVWTHFDTYLLSGELGTILAVLWANGGELGEQVTQPMQTNLFSNMTVGVDIAEITGRHQFFSPMFRGFMGLGESGLYNAVNLASKRGSSVVIPYETTGTTSVYRTKLQTSVDISGVEKNLITDEAKAQRFTARLIKAQGILYLWAMHTNSLTIYNTKVTDMLRLAGYEGRIKPEHYIDITEGIAGLFAIAVTKTDDHYTDPKTGKKVYVGKNEMYGEVVRPIGEVRAIWHKGTDGKPAYIKQLIRLEIAKGMLNPTAKRATLVSKALLRLNTLQERQYLQLGSFISDLFSQYQDKTIKGEPVALTLQTLLEYRGLTDPDSLRRVEQTKTYLKQALDKLVDIGHIAKWTVKNGNYSKLTLTGKDLDTILLIYPTATIQEALKPVINDDDKSLTAILMQEVRAEGLASTAEHYGADTGVIEAVINNRDTADSLPNTAYNELKTKAYDSSKSGKKRRAN
jgi:hypothetical protein